jgi:GNAT superfamily N-acetyltransferase
MSAVELRDEAVDGAPSRALFAEYLALVGERLAGFNPTERVFGSDDAFAATGGAWLVVYEDGRPVACGGLRTLAPGVGEIKRMFVTADARGRGHARRLLRELERRAAAHGHRSVRLLTTEVLREAMALYEAEGYRLVGRVEHARGPVEIWLEKPLLVDDEVRRRAEPEHGTG